MTTGAVRVGRGERMLWLADCPTLRSVTAEQDKHFALLYVDDEENALKLFRLLCEAHFRAEGFVGTISTDYRQP